MTYEQQNLLRQNKIYIYNFDVEALSLLKEIVEEELELRLDIESKVKAIKLAEEVEASSGNDQHVQELKDQLFLARKQYANRISAFDENKYQTGYVAYNYDTGLPYDTEDDLEAKQDGDSRLKPLKVTTDRPQPQWRITTTEPDGTEKIIGYS